METNAITILFAFLAIYYRLMWQIEINDNEKLQDQKAKLIKRVTRYRKFIRGRNPIITDLEIKRIENQ
jgi:phenylpyruvate tautomerase PptA (4-oxalocrotonate tautomerase family)